jgi:hypothetical protein
MSTGAIRPWPRQVVPTKGCHGGLSAHFPRGRACPAGIRRGGSGDEGVVQ